MAEIIQYSWKLEDDYQRRNHNPQPWEGRCDNPMIGFTWRYFKQGEENSPRDERRTAMSVGKVVHWDKESGVVVTDADEIFMRG